MVRRLFSVLVLTVAGAPHLQADAPAEQPVEQIAERGRSPPGLKHSVGRGVVSGRRAFDKQSMIQLAMPVEPGNSGGPLVDRYGRVQGILTLKSAVTDNLGFAMPVNALKPLLAKPNPVPMDKWLTIGTLDLDEWQPMMGARWRQRAGRVLVDGAGTGFGGRSVLLWNRKR